MSKLLFQQFLLVFSGFLNEISLDFVKKSSKVSIFTNLAYLRVLPAALTID